MKKFNFETMEEYAEYVEFQANKFLDECRIYGTAEDRIGQITNIMNSIKAKAKLFEIFKNSPYHNGKGQLIMPMQIERPIDEDVIYEYGEYISHIAWKYFIENREAKIDGVTYKEAYNYCYNFERYERAVEYMRLRDDEVIIKGKEFSEHRKENNTYMNIRRKFENSDLYYADHDIYTEKEDKELYSKAIIISRAIKHCVGRHLEDENDIKKLAEAFPRCQCRKGVKMSTIVQKCLKAIGLFEIAIENERETFNQKFAKWCDAISPKFFTKWSIASINYVDFLSACNGNSWTSCMNTDKHGYFTEGDWSDGFNSRRVLDYALDPSTIVFYTVDENYNGNDWELQSKITRQMFHFGEGKLVQSRLYPQATTSRRNIYTQYRENMEMLLAEALGEANLWSAPVRGVISLEENIVETPYHYERSSNYIDFLSNAAHGDYEHDFQSEVNYVIFRGSSNKEDNGIPMIVGSTNAVCTYCGEPLNEEYTNSIHCYDCYRITRKMEY